MFLLHGYTGTTIDDITQAAGVSRSSFYTYFPSKRDALLALGAQSLESALSIVGDLDRRGSDTGVKDLAHWVTAYFGHLDEHGSFAFAWTQAAQQDSEIRRAGQRGHLSMCRRLGAALAQIHGLVPASATESGLLAVSMLERVWAYSQLYGSQVDRSALERQAVRVLWEIEKAPAKTDD
ncbi:MAG: TetR/AcrR family transcriptional regulator [Acidobacteriota bacterium]|nr:TetR/AcrR family transcriptional regulator [Acidobacteriota bacterium]